MSAPLCSLCAQSHPIRVFSFLLWFFSQRFNNFLQLLSCICNIASICIEEIRELARIIDLIADIVYMTTVGCMTVRDS